MKVDVKTKNKEFNNEVSHEDDKKQRQKKLHSSSTLALTQLS